MKYKIPQSPISVCMDFTKRNLPAAVLLAQIIYWGAHPKKVNGLLWVARSGEFWRVNTGLSAKQHKTSVALLKEMGWIHSVTGYHNCYPKTHIRLSPFLAYLKFAGPNKVYFGLENKEFVNFIQNAKSIELEDIRHFTHSVFTPQELGTLK